MIVDKKIKIKITKKNITHYIKFFPGIQLKDIIDVDIDIHLMKGSNKKINVKCDLCGVDRYINFQSYNDNLNSCPEYPIYTCDKCSHIKIKEFNKRKYGVEYYSQTKEYSKRFKDTMIERYGVEYALQNIELKEKQKNNNLEKYGVENVFQSDKIKDKIKKNNMEKYGVEFTQSLTDVRDRIKNTMMDRYGVESSFQSGILREKSKNTMMNRYGVDVYAKSYEFLDKVKKTNLEKYGVEWIMESDIFKNKSKESSINNHGVDNIAKSEFHRRDFKITNDPNYIKYLYGGLSLLKCERGHEFEIPTTIYRNRTINNTPICTVCNPIGESSSIKEDELYRFICDNYKGEVIKSYRDKIEIDIYLPKLNIGFEFNGIWWHCELYKDNKYHYNKTLFFREKGIEIIHIWEDDWDNRKDIIKSMILNKIGKSSKVGARKCEIREVDNKKCKEFLNLNHIQGWCVSKYRYGLYYENDLLSIITFGALRKNLGQVDKPGSYELLRLCTKKNISISGGPSRLLNHFIKEIKPSELISYSKNDYSTGNVYNKLGFKDGGQTEPNYYWVVNNNRENRYKWRKDILVKMGYDIKMSESEIMNSNGYYRIYDSGNIKWSMTISPES